MANLTTYQALLGEIEPYSPGSLTLKKALVDQTLTGEEEYTKENRRQIMIAAIEVLKKMLILTSDTVGKDSQGFSVEGLKNRICTLCGEAGLDALLYIEVPTITDGSDLW